LDADLDDERNGSVLKMEFAPALASRRGRRTCKKRAASWVLEEREQAGELAG
jgi:hypothetical protein